MTSAKSSEDVTVLNFWAAMCGNLLTCAPNYDSKQPEHPLSLTNLRCPYEESLHPWLSTLRPVKIPIEENLHPWLSTLRSVKILIEGSLHPWLTTLRPVKILIRIFNGRNEDSQGCKLLHADNDDTARIRIASWPESSLGPLSKCTVSYVEAHSLCLSGTNSKNRI